MKPESDADPGWVAALSHTEPEAAARAIEEAAGETRLFRHLAREHAREGRESYVEIDAPLELHALVRLASPRHVVEVGVSSGVSSAYLLNALEKNGSGTLHSVDLPSFPRRGRTTRGPPRASWTLPAERSSGWAVPFGLRKRWDLRLGDKNAVLPLLADELPGIDLFVYDVPHDDRDAAREFRLLDPLVRPGGVLVVDHGPGGGLCPALSAWARACGEPPIRRRGLGLFGVRHRAHHRGRRVVRVRPPTPGSGP
jgi:hypothetical protein